MDKKQEAKPSQQLSDAEIHDAFQQRSKDKTVERRLIAESILKMFLSKQQNKPSAIDEM